MKTTAGAFAFGILFALAPWAGAHPQEASPTTEIDAPLRQMLRLIEFMEPDSAVRLGESLLRQHPDDPALNAAYLIARLDRLEDLYWFYRDALPGLLLGCPLILPSTAPPRSAAGFGRTG